MNNLRNIRLEKNFTIKEFAKKLQLSRNAISQYECNKRTPSIVIMQKMAEILDVDLQSIIYCFVKDKEKTQKE